MAAVTAIFYGGLFVVQPVIFVALPLAGIVSFIGMFCASYVVICTPEFRIRRAFVLMLLGDLFSAIAFLLIVTVILTVAAFFDTSVAQSNFGRETAVWLKMPAVFPMALLYAMTIGNWITRGAGIVMTIPPILWLTWRSRRPSSGLMR